MGGMEIETDGRGAGSGGEGVRCDRVADAPSRYWSGELDAGWGGVEGREVRGRSFEAQPPAWRLVSGQGREGKGREAARAPSWRFGGG